MTTLAHWRSPSSRLVTARLEAKPRKYDIRVVDQFYTYCGAVARANRNREAALESQHAMKRRVWTILIAASLLGYYVVERVAQAMSLF
jgi:hypothetical protein